MTGKIWSYQAKRGITSNSKIVLDKYRNVRQNDAQLERKECCVARFEKEDVLTSREACELLRISRPTLRNLISKGEISAFKIGNNWRIMRTELERYVKDKSTTRRAGPETNSSPHPPGTG
jgi:excisionase family DNA binding protein